jgi:hypothetical protein
MRAYRVTLEGRVRFAGSAAEASATRRMMVEALETPKRAGSIEPIEIPTGKVGLLPWLNQQIADLEAIVSFEGDD